MICSLEFLIKELNKTKQCLWNNDIIVYWIDKQKIYITKKNNKNKKSSPLIDNNKKDKNVTIDKQGLSRIKHKM